MEKRKGTCDSCGFFTYNIRRYSIVPDNGRMHSYDFCLQCYAQAIDHVLGMVRPRVHATS